MSKTGNWVNAWRENKDIISNECYDLHESKEVYLIVVTYHDSDFNFPGLLRFA